MRDPKQDYDSPRVKRVLTGQKKDEAGQDCSKRRCQAGNGPLTG
jgi:hypothetical protein